MTLEEREQWMKRWDSWVKYYCDGGRASWPRDAFESLLDWIDDQTAEEMP